MNYLILNCVRLHFFYDITAFIVSFTNYLKVSLVIK